MPKAEFFSRLGLFVIERFLDPALCERLWSEMCLVTNSQAAVIGKSGERVNECIRKTKWANVSAATVSLLEEGLRAIKPMLESHFDLALADFEEPQFLLYKEGDFFRPHRDHRGNSVMTWITLII